MTDEVEVYLSQEDIDWANENRRLMPKTFSAAFQCPLANALWRYFGEGELIGVGINNYGSATTMYGRLGALATLLRKRWDNGEEIEPQWFTILPGEM